MKETEGTLLILILAALLLMASCREQMYVDMSNYKIEIATQNDMLYLQPDRDPSLYRVLFYDRQTHNLVTSNTVGTDGGFLYNVEPGTYDVVVHSYQNSKTTVSYNDNLQTLIATSSVLSYKDVPIVRTPDHLFVQVLKDVRIPHLTRNDPPWILKCAPRSIVQSWKIYIEGIKGLENAGIIDVYLSGQSQGKLIGDGHLAEENAAVYFRAVPDLMNGVIDCPFTTFGKKDGEHAMMTLNIVIMGVGGDTYICKADVTDQFDDPTNIDHIIRAYFDVIIHERMDGGFNPHADKWDAIWDIIEIS